MGRHGLGCLIGSVATVGILLTPSLSHSATFSVIHTFDQFEGSGDIELSLRPGSQFNPYAPPSFFGSASMGGPGEAGSLFDAQLFYGLPNVQIVPVFEFGMKHGDGFGPTNLVSQGGVRFGTTAGTESQCGAPGGVCGVLFSFNNTTRDITILHRFAGGAKGASATALIGDGASGVFGVSAYGGGVHNVACGPLSGQDTGGCGYVFQMSPGQPLKIIHKFAGGRQGGFPSQVVRRPDGSLVGTATGGLNDSAREIIYTLGPGGAFNVVYSYLGTGHCYLNLGPKLLADSKGNVYATSQACPFGGNGAAILEIDTLNAVRMVRYAKNMASTSASYAIYSFDASDVLYLSEANQVLTTDPPRYDYVTEIFSVDTTGKKVDLVWKHNLAVTSLVPVTEDYIDKPTTDLYGAGQLVSTSENSPNSTILFHISLP